MRERGYVDGKNLSVEWRFADDQRDRLPRFAAELVRLNVDVIVVQGTPSITAAQKATTSIPIVMTGTVTRSPRASSKAWRGPAATSPASRTSLRRFFPNTWKYSSAWFINCLAWPYW